MTRLLKQQCPVCGAVHGPDPTGEIGRKHRRDLMLVPPAKVREWVAIQKQMRGEGWRPRLASVQPSPLRVAQRFTATAGGLHTAGWAGSGYGGTLRPGIYKAGEGAAAAARGEELHGWDKYAQLVTEAYKKAPKRSGDGVKSFQALQEHIVTMFTRMQSKIQVEFVEDDPYQSAAQMEEEVKATGVLKVYTGFNQAEAWDRPEINLMLRAVHDFAAHLGAMGKGKARAFNQKGELQAYNKHLNLIGCQSKAAGALFTEIVGQASYFWHTGQFPTQKIVTLPEFNWCKLGEVAGYRIVDGDLVR